MSDTVQCNVADHLVSDVAGFNVQHIALKSAKFTAVVLCSSCGLLCTALPLWSAKILIQVCILLAFCTSLLQCARIRQNAKLH